MIVPCNLLPRFSSDFVRCEMPFLATTMVIFVLPLASAYVSAAGVDNSPIAVTALQAKADQAYGPDRPCRSRMAQRRLAQSARPVSNRSIAPCLRIFTSRNGTRSASGWMPSMCSISPVMATLTTTLPTLTSGRLRIHAAGLAPLSSRHATPSKMSRVSIG